MNIEALSPAEQAQLQALLGKLQPGETPAQPKKKARARQTIKYLTEHETEAFFRAIDSPRDKAIFMLAYKRGLRAREISGFQLSDYIERDDRLMLRRLKGSIGGEYHLTKAEVKSLKDYLKVRGREPGVLFPSRVGKPISQQQLWLLAKKYATKAGIDKPVSIRAMKHSCGTHLLNRGESIEDVQNHLGHRQIQNTLVYAQFTNKRRIERDKRLRDW